MRTEATEINIGFIKRMKQGLPWVRVKLAMSLDGRTALANGASQWITGEPARNDVQRWRARSSAVMTGVGTVLADDPQLSVRGPGFKGRQPLRVVLDSGAAEPAWREDVCWARRCWFACGRRGWRWWGAARRAQRRGLVLPLPSLGAWRLRSPVLPLLRVWACRLRGLVLPLLRVWAGRR